MLIRDILGHRLDTLPDPYNEIIWADTDEDGNYLMSGVLPVEMQSLVLSTPQPTSRIFGLDITPDGDFHEEEENTIINITVDTEEQDDGNNFVVQLSDISAVISGYVNVDIDEDGVSDEAGENVRIKLSVRDENGDPQSGTTSLFTVFTNNNGYYEFNNLAPGEYVVSFGAVDDYVLIESGDSSPDSDIILGSMSYWIPADVIEDEHDADNNFLVTPKHKQGSGSVLEDTDGDGIGDAPLGGMRIELYERNGNGVPQGDIVSWTYSNSTGFYRFQNLPIGEYVIQFIGTIEYQCISGEDETPEAGEPTNNVEVIFIQMDVIDIEVEDEDNIFTVREV